MATATQSAIAKYRPERKTYTVKSDQYVLGKVKQAAAGPVFSRDAVILVTELEPGGATVHHPEQ